MGLLAELAPSYGVEQRLWWLPDWPSFRLLRVLKLVRFLPALRRQLVVLMRTMDNVATFCMLLMLFIFIFRWVGPKLLPQTAPGMVGGAAPF